MSDFYDPEVYDARVGDQPGDIEFYKRLALDSHAAGQPVLELACGTGRVSIPIAREGVQLVGLDRSPEMLARAREKSAGLEVVRWVEGDMRRFELPERFGLVFIPFRSFLHLMTIDDQLSCLGCIREHLLPDGRLALNIFNPDLVMMGQSLSVKRGLIERRGDRYRHPRTGRAVEIWETRAYHPASQEIVITWVDEELDDEETVVSCTYRTLKLRYTYRFEMEHLLARAGFKIEALHGDFFGSAFDDSSSEMVWVARPLV